MDPLHLPKLDQYVNDLSGVLSAGEREILNELFANHEKNTTEQVVVVLFPHRQGRELLDIGLKLFQENGIGQKGQNNGLLLIIATEEKKIRLITGKGMEIKYSEMRCRDIIENQLRPLLNQGNYQELIRTFSGTVSSTQVYQESVSAYSEKQSKERSKAITIVGGFSTFFAALLVDSMITGFISIGIAVILLFVIGKIKSSNKIPIGMLTYIFPLLLLFIGIIAVTRPASCTLQNESVLSGKNYRCQRDIFGYNYSYTMTVGGYHSSSSDGSSSSSHWDSGGSSFGGGGGSSNGGGYGD